MPCYLNKFEISFKYISIAYYNKLPEEIKKALTKQYFAKKTEKNILFIEQRWSMWLQARIIYTSR